MENTDKARAALEQLRAEKERRLRARIDAGELTLVPKIITLYEGETFEQAEARASAFPIPDGVVYDFVFVDTGVPMIENFSYEPGSQPDLVPEPEVPDLEASVPELTEPEGPEVEESSDNHFEDTEPKYVAVTIRYGADDGDPGEIREAWYSVKAGELDLTNPAGHWIAGRTLREGENPSAVAKKLLRDSLDEVTSEFDRPLRYRNAGINRLIKCRH